MHDPNAHKSIQDLLHDALMTHNKIVCAVSPATQFLGMAMGVEEEESIPWDNWITGNERLRAAMLMRVSILKDAGTGSLVTWEIRQKEAGTGVEVVASGSADSLDHDEFFVPFVPWHSTQEDAKKGLMFFALTCTNGTLDARVRIMAEPRR